MDINNCSNEDLISSLYNDTNLFLQNLFVGCGIVITGTSIAICLVAQNLFRKIDKEYRQLYGYDSDNEEIFESKYLEDYKNLESKDVDLINLKDKIVIENTPDGSVYMGYDSDKEGFFYYSDNSIKYFYLEVVARKFVIEYDCKNILYNTGEEIMKSLYNKYIKNKNVVNKDTNSNIFAKFKVNKPDKKVSVDYNLKVIDKEIPVPENTNKYFYRGKFKNYEEDRDKKNLMVENKNSDIEEFETIDYNTFKNK
jgi:hypothetical protein